MKLCKDCKWLKATLIKLDSFDWDTAYCVRPHHRPAMRKNLVTGKEIPIYCEIERVDSFISPEERCGVEGRFWEKTG